MGKVLSLVQRQAYKFNAESRAHKVISKDKPVPAPKHEKTVNIIERIRTDHPEFLEQQSRKDSELDAKLKHVFVKSEENKIAMAPDSTRPLPQNRDLAGDPEYGFVEPEIIPQGHFTLRQAIKFIGDHQTDPTTYTATAIAKEYKLDANKTEMILEHFKAFMLFMPEGKRPQLSSSKPWLHQLTPGETQLTPGKTQLTPGETQLTPGETQLTPGKTQLTPGETQLTPGETQLTPGKTQLTPGKTQTDKESS